MKGRQGTRTRLFDDHRLVMATDFLSPNVTPSRIGRQKSRGRKEPSGVFSLFQTAQIQQFKEAFSLIDQDGDGTVSEQDLKAIFASLGMSSVKYVLLMSLINI